MNKVLRVVVIFLVVDAVIAAAYFGYRALSGNRPSPQDEYPWVTVDENYRPANAVEEFVKADARQKGLLPVQLRNFGRNTAVLKKFRGSRFAGANEAVLEMAYRGLQDWMIIDLRYKDEKQREINRTMLYVQMAGQWTVGDSGRLMK
jgi:hypothetical protein